MRIKTPTPAVPYREPSEADKRTAAIGGGKTSFPVGYRTHGGPYSDYQRK